MTVRIHPVGDPETPKTWAWPKRASCSCEDWPGMIEFTSWLRLPRLYGSWPYSLTPDRRFVVPRHGSEIDPCCPIHGE
jgi:hypothetical protein